MWEYLPKYIAASQSGVLPSVPILVEETLPKKHRQALELMFSKGTAIITLPAYATARVRRLWCAPSLMYIGILEKINERYKWDYFAPVPSQFAAVAREMGHRANHVPLPATSGPELLFLARK